MINIVFDFDSTLVQNESFNDVLKLALNNDTEKVKLVDEIVDKAMNGLITPEESMNFRLKIASFDKTLIEKVVKETKITDGMESLVAKLKQDYNLFIVSGGFKEMIIPVAKKIGIEDNEIYANDFKYENNIVVGVEKSLLLQEQGKVKLLNKLKDDGILKGEIITIGDGWTDFETYKFGAANHFIAFGGVVRRERVFNEATLKANDMKELEKIIYSI
ncbi:MAG: HAD-IB family phosphatase [Rickettsiales bacterium]|jgi:HAD superfamily phosphoserine phosphatase-like hydrolase|nr:HAD-IB family phosphatase [Rickettsiales bacterium]